MPELPAGTVTFLYTDVEGSTRLWEEEPEAMGQAMARHDAIVRSAIETRGGQVFRTGGDAFCAAFATAGPAVANAAAIQRTLAAEPWPLNQALAVRVVLHTTAAEPRDGDYVGGGLNRLGRLLVACHGGQTLLSQTTEQLVRDQLPAGTSLRDLGQHRFRDLSQPDRIFQLVISGLPADFPPLKSLDDIPNNLPAQLTSFVGRQREVAEVVSLLTASPALGGGERLVSLTGPGGTGKTRLSLQAAAELLEHFPDGVWLVELAPISDPGLVAQSIATALGLRELGGRPLDAMLADYLRDQRALLVLDNCEHLIDEAARLADMLLRACPDLRVLASSREPLGIGGEKVLRVPSLAVPDLRALPRWEELAQFEAVQLFAERAASVQPGFRLTAENAAALAQISCRLDGIPLALELAAARVRSLAPEQIAARLDDRFRLLTGGSRAAVQRQQTLQALIDWSYDLLSPQECILLRRLAVFAGGFTLEAAEGACAWDGVDAWDVLNLLDQLVNKSLVSADSRGDQARYRMQETIRQYAQDKLVGAGEAKDARTRHLGYFAAQLAQADVQWRTVQRSQWVRWFGREQDNLRAAVAWALETDLEAALAVVYDLCWYWPQVASVTEGRRYVARALAQAEARPDALTIGDAEPRRQLLLAGAWFADGFMAFTNGLGAETRSAMEKAIALLRPLGKMELLAPAYGFAGLGALFSGEFEAGLAYGQEALSLARQAGDRWMEAMQHISFGSFGMVAVGAEEAAGSASLKWEEGMAIMRELRDGWGEAMGHMVAGNALVRGGDLAAAQRHFEQSALLFEDAGYGYMTNISRSGLADVARLQGDYGRALALYPAVIRVWRLADHRGAIARCLECLGFIAGLQAAGAAEPRPLLWRAATLCGAAEAIRRASSVPMSPWEVPEYEGHVNALRERLDPEVLAAAWQAGEGMDLDQAVAFAMEGPEGLA